jgi:hypothetical protein
LTRDFCSAVPQRKPASYYGQSAPNGSRQDRAVGSLLARLALDAALIDAYKFLVRTRAQTRPGAEGERAI